MNPAYSLAQNIDELFFGQDPILASEYDFLFSSLFNDANLYRKVVETLAIKLKGMTREELVQTMKTSNNGKLSEVLDNLKKCDFLRSYQAFGKKKKGCFISYQICLRCSTSDLSRTTMAWMSMHGAICLKETQCMVWLCV